MDKIRIELKHESYFKVYPKELQDELSENINSMLEEVNESVIRYNGYVKITETDSGNFRVEPMCDNIDLRDTMTDLLPEVLAGK